MAPAEKTDETRQRVVEALHGEWRAPARRRVRINGVATRLVLSRRRRGRARRRREHLDCIMVPKVHDASHVHFVDHLLTQLELDLGLTPGGIGLELQIESGPRRGEDPGDRRRLAAAPRR